MGCQLEGWRVDALQIESTSLVSIKQTPASKVMDCIRAFECIGIA